nr:hypothetical protein [Tanacetum cinerariifolium]
MDVQTPTSVAPLPVSAPTLTPSTIATFAGAVFSILRIVQRYMDQRMNEAVKVAVQIQSDRLRDEAQAENDDFLKTIDENMQKIIKEQVKEHVKESFDPIPKTPKNTNDEGNGEENLGTNVGREEGHDEEEKEEEDELYRDVNINLGRDNDEFLKTIDENIQNIIKEQSSNSSKTSNVVAADLSEMELKKILIEKMEGNKSIHRSNKQSNLSKALVEAYESNKIILDTYGDTVTLKRRQSSQHLEWYSQQNKPPTPYRDWNKTSSATHGAFNHG